MPPAISDDEKSEPDQDSAASSPPKKGREKKAVSYIEIKEDEPEADTVHTNGDSGEDDDGDDDGELEEDEYVVEKILSHIIADDGQPRFEVKWEGFEKKSDRTWEPEENLRENAWVTLDEYFDSIGGREKIFEDTKRALTTKKRGRTASSTPATNAKRARKNGTHPAETTPPVSVKAAQWKPPAGSWDDLIATLEACEDEEKHELVVYLTWKNGNKTQHPLQVIYKRAPQKMLQFYERHVRIIKRDDTAKANEATAEE